MKKNILSGIKPTGQPTLGNYIGLLSRLKEYQSSDNQCFYFIPNLHDLANDISLNDWADNTYNLIAWMISLGVDPNKSYIYLESDIPAISQIMVVLNYFVSMGELSRQTQFKDKAQKGSYDSNYAGLFEYPVLMAADILAFDANIVPVGDDQRQHVELARDIAQRFNHKTNTTIMTIPEVMLPLCGARIKSLTNPLEKMSKSESSKSYILLEDSADSINAKIQAAVTDSFNSIEYNHINRPAISNLIDIYYAFSGQDIDDIVALYSSDTSYKRFKDDLAQIIISTLETLQQNHRQYHDRAYINTILQQSKDKLNVIANEKLEHIYQAIGVIRSS